MTEEPESNRIRPEEKADAMEATISPFGDEGISDVLESLQGKDLSWAKTHWFFGDWEALADLDVSSLAGHVDRDRFALLIASAHQQLGDQEKAREYSRLALKWGCSPRVVAQILIAGVHNTLGRISALRQDGERVKQHFGSAVDVVSHSTETTLISHARAVREMAKMGLMPQADGLVPADSERAKKSSAKLDYSGQPSATFCGEQNLHLRQQAFRYVWSSKSMASVGPNTPMQMVVLGMHRSGTSTITGLIRKMGAYTSDIENAMPADERNPMGYWERMDLYRLNESLLRELGGSWCKLSNVDLGKIDEDALGKYRERFSKILNELNEHKFWVLKDPRMCILFPLIEDLLENPVVVYIYRDPIEVAASLKKRNGFPEKAGFALWELYNLHALNASKGQRKIILSYANLVESRVSVAGELHRLLSECTENVKWLSEVQVEEVIDRGLYRNRSTFEDHDSLSFSQRTMLEKIERAEFLNDTYLDIELDSASLDLLKNFETTYCNR